MIKELYDIKLINEFLKKFNQSIENIDEPFRKYIGYIVDDKIVAFLNYSLIYDHIEIEYIYVNNECRNKGIATKLIEYLVKFGTKNSCLNITLEVRCSNKVAIKFYQKNHFEAVSIRKNYYNGEDGILMLRELV